MKIYFSQGLGVAMACEAASGVKPKYDVTTGANKLKFTGGSSIQSSFNKDFYRSSVDNTYRPSSSGFLTHRTPKETESTRTNFGLAMFLGMNAARIPGNWDDANNILNAKCASVHCFTHILWRYFTREITGSGNTVQDMKVDDSGIEWRYYDGLVRPTIDAHTSWLDAYPFYRWMQENGASKSDNGMNIAANPSDPHGKNTEAMTKWKGYDGKERDYSSRESRTCDQANWRNEYLYSSIRKVSPFWTNPTAEKGGETAALDAPGSVIAGITEHYVAREMITVFKDMGALPWYEPGSDWLKLKANFTVSATSNSLQADDLTFDTPVGIATGEWKDGSSQGAYPEIMAVARSATSFSIAPSAGSETRFLSWREDKPDGAWTVSVANCMPRAEYCVSRSGRTASVPSIKNDHLIGAAFLVCNHICVCGFEDGINDGGPGGWEDTGPQYVHSPFDEETPIVDWTLSAINFNLRLWSGGAWGIDWDPGYDDSYFLTFTSTLTTAPWQQFYAVSIDEFKDDDEDALTDEEKMAVKAINDQLNGGSNE